MSLFKNFNIEKYKSMKPPANNSLASYSEVQKLRSIPMDKKMVEKNDNIVESFREVFDKNKIPYPEKEVKKLQDDAAPVVLKLKNYFNRPRPKELAKSTGKDIPNIEMPSMATPSYPSGHSTQAYLIGGVMSDKYPQMKTDLMSKAKEISYSRNVARAHYKTDSDMGEKLGKDMHAYLKSSPMKKKPAGAPDWHDSDAPDAHGKFRDLSASSLASWLIKSRKGNLSKIISSLNQQIVFNRKKKPAYAAKMRKTQDIVRKRLGKKKDE